MSGTLKTKTFSLLFFFFRTSIAFCFFCFIRGVSHRRDASLHVLVKCARVSLLKKKECYLHVVVGCVDHFDFRSLHAKSWLSEQAVVPTSIYRSPPPGSCLGFVLSRTGFGISLRARRFSSNLQYIRGSSQTLFSHAMPPPPFV